MVLGFLFTEGKGIVALIEKNKPEWQKGLLNGIGGKIEEGETPIQAMIREFEEEAGLYIEDWKQFAIMQGNDWKVYCYKAFSERIWDYSTMTDEIIYTKWIEDLHKNPFNYISNLQWLIEMALDGNDNFQSIITYK